MSQLHEVWAFRDIKIRKRNALSEAGKGKKTLLTLY